MDHEVVGWLFTTPAIAATSEQEAFNALGQWPIIQGAVALLIALGGGYAIFRGVKDRNRSGGDNEDSLSNARLRSDLMEVMAANRLALFVEVKNSADRILAALDVAKDRVGRLETKVAVLEALDK